MSFFTDLRNQQAQAANTQPTASPATPTAMQPAAAPQQQQPWGGFTLGNIGQYGYGVDLNPLSQQTGIPRDTLAQQRDDFIRPIESSYRTQTGGQADATSANLIGSPQFQNFAQTGNIPGGLPGTGAASNQYPFGSAVAPFTGQFQAPSAEQAAQTPGLQFALSRAQQAMERSAAAKGTLLTGGLQRDLADQQIGMALQGYGDVYNRSRSEFDLGRSIFESNQDRPFQKYLSLGELGRPV